MKKIKEGLLDFIIGTIFIVIMFIFIAIMFSVPYFEKEYEVTRYLWIFNIGSLVLMPLYYFLYNYKEKINTRKLEDKIILKNIDFQYYRDIIEEYSPAMLSLILDGLEFDKDLGASVIYLINKGYLKLQDKNKIIRTDKDYSKLPEDLKIICDSDVNHLLACKRIKAKNVNEEMQSHQSGKTRLKWLNTIEKQAVEKGLANEKEDKSWKTILILFIIGIIESLFAMYIESYELLFFSGLVTFLLIILRFWAFDENKFVKTQKGYELYTKIVGLKNYIKDYSNLSESKLKEISIWEDYLIYAIIFNDTSKLNKEAKYFYETVCNVREEEPRKPKIKKSIIISSILSLSIPFITLIAAWNEIFSSEIGIIILLLNFFLIQKGKSYNKEITILGYVFNSIVIPILILFVIILRFYAY